MQPQPRPLLLHRPAPLRHPLITQLRNQSPNPGPPEEMRHGEPQPRRRDPPLLRAPVQTPQCVDTTREVRCADGQDGAQPEPEEVVPPALEGAVGFFGVSGGDAEEGDKERGLDEGVEQPDGGGDEGWCCWVEC